MHLFIFYAPYYAYYDYSCAPGHIHAKTPVEFDGIGLQVWSGSDQHANIRNSITTSITNAITWFLSMMMSIPLNSYACEVSNYFPPWFSGPACASQTYTGSRVCEHILIILWCLSWVLWLLVRSCAYTCTASSRASLHRGASVKWIRWDQHAAITISITTSIINQITTSIATASGQCSQGGQRWFFLCAVVLTFLAFSCLFLGISHIFPAIFFDIILGFSNHAKNRVKQWGY